MGETRSDYEQGFVDALRAYAYTSSQPWAESGVHYVGTTGRTLAEAIEQVRETHTFAPPFPDDRHRARLDTLAELRTLTDAEIELTSEALQELHDEVSRATAPVESIANRKED